MAERTRHVGDALLEGDGDGGVPSRMAREKASPWRVYWSHGGEGFGFDAGAGEVAAVVDEEARGAVGRGVEGDLDFDAAFGSEEVDALVGDELGAAGEDGMAGGEVEEGGGEAVSLQLGSRSMRPTTRVGSWREADSARPGCSSSRCRRGRRRRSPGMLRMLAGSVLK